jgi:chromate transporter
MKSISLARLTGIFLRIGNLTFGGGDPATAALYSELVVARGWLSREKYGMAFALARVTPGTNMLAFCAGSAWELAGWRAAVLAVLAASLPAAVSVALLSAAYDALKRNGLAVSAISGLLAASVGLMLTGAWLLLQPEAATRKWRRIARAAVLAGGALLLAHRFRMAPVQVLGLAALAGYFWQGSAE